MGGLQPQHWQQRITEQWKLHHPEAQYLLSMQDVKYIISTVRGFVVQGRDHAPDDLHVFCPNFYWQVLKNTFSDTKVDSSCTVSPSQATAFLQGKASQSWFKPYKWGINMSATIPVSCVLLKKEDCSGQANYFLQQLHVWQVASSSKHCVEHFASCSVSWKFWTSTSTRDFSRPACMSTQCSYGCSFGAPQPGPPPPDISETAFTVQFAATEPNLQVFSRAIEKRKIRTGVFGSKMCVNSVSYPCKLPCSLT